MRGAPPPERVPVAGIDLLAALNPVALPLVTVLRRQPVGGGHTWATTGAPASC